jgi:hypothetical protein
VTGRAARRLRVAIAAAAVASPAAAPATALAHAGHTNQVASSYAARITSVPPGIAVKVVDGDQRMWMSVNPRLTVIVVGLYGESYLRFSARGVDENVRSPTVYLNRAVPSPAPGRRESRMPPLWRHLTDAHTYMWHEDRLHSLAAAARSPSSGDIGRWIVPLAVGGRRETITGMLEYAAPPSRVWLWPLVVVVACAVALLRVGEPRITRALARALAFATLPAVVVGRAGRELYGHPTVSFWQIADLAATGVFAFLVIVALTRRRGWEIGALATGAGGVYEGVALLPALTHGYVLSALPAAVERLAASVSLAGGAGLMLTVAFLGVGRRVAAGGVLVPPLPTPAADPRPEPG